jgi:hypothetical protein
LERCPKVATPIRIDHPGDKPAFVAPQFCLLFPKPAHHNIAEATTGTMANPACHHCLQDRAIHAALHEAAFVADQLQHVALSAGQPCSRSSSRPRQLREEWWELVGEGVHLA